MMTAAELYHAARVVQQRLAPLRAEMMGMIRRVVVGSSKADASDTSRFTGSTFGDTATDGEHLQQYGFGSRPPNGAEGLFFKKLGVMICADFRSKRPGLADGEVAMWHRSGAQVVMREDGSIVILQAGSGKIEIGGEPAAALVARSDRVEAELTQIATALGSATAPSGGGPVTYASPYSPPGVNDTGADNARVT